MTTTSLLLAFAALLAPPDEAASSRQDALRTIEGTRGGRHWVEAQTAPPKSPEKSEACFRIEPGFEIQLVASEPLVMDPVALAFDHLGRMFVVEYGDYPTGPENGGPPLSRVVLLQDDDHDGRMDRRVVFADKLQFAHSLMPYRDGLLVGAQTEILYLKDSDGDGKADIRESLYSGFLPAHPQMQIGNPRWGFDNWIYLNYGPGEIHSNKEPDAKPFKMPRTEFRFHPGTRAFGPASGLGQFGNSIDNWGRRFFCTNRNPIMTPMLSWHQARRNPFFPVSRTHADVGPSGGETRVYPLVAMKSNYLSHAGTHTSACGTTAYHGDLLGIENSVFVCEPIGHLVTRTIVEPEGAELTARRPQPKADFLASSDTWFRPASLATGPDGALYLADMYRLWVEHPKFLPEDVAKKLDWRAGEDRGRIWRLVPKKAAVKIAPYKAPQDTPQLVAMLRDPNGWRRQVAHRLLVERADRDATAALSELLRSTDSTEQGALTRLHVLSILDGLETLQPEHLLRGLQDAHPEVRKAAVRLAARQTDPQVLAALLRGVQDPDARVRYEVALAAGDIEHAQVASVLAELVRKDGQRPWFDAAILSSSRTVSGEVLTQLLADPSFIADGSPARIQLVRDLSSVVGARGDLDEWQQLLKLLGASSDSSTWWKTATLSGLATGLPRYRGERGKVSLASLLTSPPESLAKLVAPVNALLEESRRQATNAQAPLADRLAAIELLGYQSLSQSLETYRSLLSQRQPLSIQSACLDALNRNAGDQAGDLVLKHWNQWSPSVRSSALALLLRRTPSTRTALQAMQQGTINAAGIDIDQRVRLLRHGDSEIRALAGELFGGAISDNRREVAEQYRPALSAKSSSAAGHKVFQRTCAKCHRIDGEGHSLGPDISDVRNRSREALLYDILDPNRKVEPQFADYLIVTDDGRIFNGLLASESDEAVILKQPEGKQHVIPRGKIETLRVSGKSLMPEGVEKEINLQQMADLLEFLKSRDLPTTTSE